MKKVERDVRDTWRWLRGRKRGYGDGRERRGRLEEKVS